MQEILFGAQALANDKRLLILEWLKNPASYFGAHQPYDEEEGVCGLYIAQNLGISAASTSVHLKLLTQAGLIRSLRVGKFTYFRRVEPAIAALAERIAGI
jgi:ArsR family transcriptional regulator